MSNLQNLVFCLHFCVCQFFSESHFTPNLHLFSFWLGWRSPFEHITEHQHAGFYNLLGICLGSLGDLPKVQGAILSVFGQAEGLEHSSSRWACAQGLGIAARTYFEIVLTSLDKALKRDVAVKRPGSFGAWLGKSAAVTAAEQLRAAMALALGQCARHAPNQQILYLNIKQMILFPLQDMLKDETAGIAIVGALQAIHLCFSTLLCTTNAEITKNDFQTGGSCLADEFTRPNNFEDMEAGATHRIPVSVLQDLQDVRNSLILLVLPHAKIQPEMDTKRFDVSKSRTHNSLSQTTQNIVFENDCCCSALAALTSLVNIPIAVSRDSYAHILQSALDVFGSSYDMLLKGAEDKHGENADDTSPLNLYRGSAASSLLQSLIHHSDHYSGISAVFSAVWSTFHGRATVAARRELTSVFKGLASACPVLEANHDATVSGDQNFNDVGNWAECVALVLPRAGDSDDIIRTDALASLQSLLSRCIWTRDFQMLNQGQEHCGTIASPTEQIVSFFVKAVPSVVLPAFLQHLLPALCDDDPDAAASIANSVHCILSRAGSAFEPSHAEVLAVSILDAAEKINFTEVKLRTLDCMRQLAISHFEVVFAEMLEFGPSYSSIQILAIQLLAKEKSILLKLFNCLTDSINNVDLISTEVDGKTNDVENDGVVMSWMF